MFDIFPGVDSEVAKHHIWQDAIKQIVDGAAAVIAEEVEADVIRCERRRLIGLIRIHFGEEAADRFSKIASLFDPPSNHLIRRS